MKIAWVVCHKHPPLNYIINIEKFKYFYAKRF